MMSWWLFLTSANQCGQNNDYYYNYVNNNSYLCSLFTWTSLSFHFFLFFLYVILVLIYIQGSHINIF